MEYLIQVKNISKQFRISREHSIDALKNISLRVEPGDFIVVMGPSGSGKSTFLNCVSTIDSPTAGRVVIAGCNVQALTESKLNEFRYQQLGFIFQNYNLVENFTNSQNISLGLVMHKEKKELVKKRVHRVAQQLGIVDILNKYPSVCSGGQQQRVAIARALVTNPNIIVADEPTGNLDSKNTKDIMEILCELNEQGKTILLVTHDCQVASYAKRVLYLMDGEIKEDLKKEHLSRQDFYQKILNVNTQQEFTSQKEGEVL